MELILASNSPRRKQILTENGFNFTVIPSSVNEPENIDKSPDKYAEFLAELKATDVFNKNSGVVLGADTIVYLDGLILGKPKDKEDAIKTLKLLSNKTHVVCTGYAIISENKKVISSEKTYVTFNELSNELILDYVNSGLCMDKAGSYGIQDGYPLVKEIKGDYQNVVGLPINKIKGILKELL
jgi:septum formation protein